VSLTQKPPSEAAVARPKTLKPAYCHHKPSKHAFVTLDGRRLQHPALSERYISIRVNAAAAMRSQRPDSPSQPVPRSGASTRGRWILLSRIEAPAGDFGSVAHNRAVPGHPAGC
jgi:hypothetical protein